MQNEKQIPKEVRSETPQVGPVLQAFQVPDKTRIQGAVRLHLQSIYEQLQDGSHPLGKNGKVSVYVLGRYNADEHYLPPTWKRDFGDKMTVEFRTIHKSKGSEADYIVLPHLARHGFPSRKEDDPVLRLAMPAEDPFPKSEERRLFYVALTRARRSVAMFTVQGRESPFLIELIKDGWVEVLDADGEPSTAIICPKCENGVMVHKMGRNGPFLSCTNFPPCRKTLNVPQQPAVRQAKTAGDRRSMMLNTLGNLTLITGSLNPALSNSKWTIKRPELLKFAKLNLTQYFHGPDADEWDEAAIEKRTTHLYSQLERIWP